jgi:hypothetical protein
MLLWGASLPVCCCFFCMPAVVSLDCMLTAWPGNILLVSPAQHPHCSPTCSDSPPPCCLPPLPLPPLTASYLPREFALKHLPDNPLCS